MVIVYGWSALSFWRTPPIVRTAAVELAHAVPAMTHHHMADALAARKLQAPRSDASEATRLIYEHILTDLVGIPLPIHVCVDPNSSSRPNDYLVPHRTRRPIPKKYLYDLGGGLFVASPTLAVQQAITDCELPHRITLLDECCGLYAIFRPTKRAQTILNALEQAGALPQKTRTYACYDEGGQFIPYLTEEDDSQLWSPARKRDGSLTNLWKRPPLLRVEQLATNIKSTSNLWGHKNACQTVKYAMDGSASPLETQCALLLFLPPRYGGEHWPLPLLNKRIVFDQKASKIAGVPSCVGDEVWDHERAVLEINGFEYHADRDGFLIQSGRPAALRSMGYKVLDINHDQMKDPLKFETMLEVFSSELGFPLQKRSVKFIMRRAQLHDLLFTKRLP